MDEPLTSTADVEHAIAQMDGKVQEWWVWGDEKEPYVTDVDRATMKAYVDKGHAEGKLELYGENTRTGEYYEGEG
jgi:hypothetical protein